MKDIECPRKKITKLLSWMRNLRHRKNSKRLGNRSDCASIAKPSPNSKLASIMGKNCQIFMFHSRSHQNKIKIRQLSSGINRNKMPLKTLKRILPQIINRPTNSISGKISGQKRKKFHSKITMKELLRLRKRHKREAIK